MSKTPSIAVIPSGYKGAVSGANGTVYSVIPTNGDADLDFTRDCVATRVNQNGLLEEVGLNVPRLDYSDGGCPSLLLEPQRRNYGTDAIVGQIFGTVDVTNKVISPSGLIDSIVPIPTSTANRFQYVQSPSIFQTDDVLTYSWYRKRISTPIDDSNIGDLRIGIGSTSLVNLEVLGEAEQIESDINGFDRFQQSVKVIDGSLSSTFRAYFGDVVGVGNQSVAYYGHQFELGSYATSLIYTSGTEVTRFKDEASKDNLESYINSSEGVLYVEMSSLNNPTDLNSYISLTDGETDQQNYISLVYETNGNLTFRIRVDNVDSTFKTKTINQNELNKIAFSYKENEFKFFVNGSNFFADDNLGQTFPQGTLSKLSFDYANQSNNFRGKIKDLRVYNEALTDAELITLTQ